MTFVFAKQSEPSSLCDLRSPCDDCRHAFYQRYGTNLPSSLRRVVPSRLGFLCQGHLCWFWVRSFWVERILFSWTPGLSETLLPFSDLNLFSSLKVSEDLFTLAGVSPCSLSRMCQEIVLRCRVYQNGVGILTYFPFTSTGLPSSLGPPNPWLMNVAKEPVPFRRLGFSPRFDVTNTRIFISTQSTRPYGRASTRADRPSIESLFLQRVP